MAAGPDVVEVGAVVDLRVERIATGGEGVARGPDGRTLFVAGALPGEGVTAEVVEVRKRHGRARLLDVVDPSPHRRPPPCPHVAEGCGGCDWQHVDGDAQRDLRVRIVTDALTRLGGLPDPRVEVGEATPDRAVRTTLRAAVVDGRAGFRRRGSHDVVVVGSCLVAHPAAEEVLVAGRFGTASEVVVRVGARTGERMVVVDVPTGQVEDEVEVPDGVQVVGADGSGHLVEEAGGRPWRVSARSFFQTSPQAADALVVEVGAGIDRLAELGIVVAPDRSVMVDLCAGVGSFAGTVGRRFGPVVAVEPSPSAVADARHNLGPDVEVVEATMARWRPTPADVVVADPPRAGLGRTGVDVVAATGASGLVLVSCDPASLGRDARLLADAGLRLVRSRVLDLFPQTSHVEVVSTFVSEAGSHP